MKRILAITLLCTTVALVVSSQAKNVPHDVQQTLISLDKQWGEAMRQRGSRREDAVVFVSRDFTPTDRGSDRL